MKELAEQVSALGSIVTVWAHPDDESYLAAGLMSIARRAGAAVTCVIATDGDFAESASARPAIGRRRLKEVHRALDVLDVQDREFLHLPDGGCASLDPAAPSAAIARILENRAPATIVTFGPDGFTGHGDHRAVSHWTTEAVRRVAPASRLLYPTATAELVAADRDINDRFPIFDDGLPATHPRDCLALELDLADDDLDRKMCALRCHDSQTRGLIDSMGQARYRRWVATELFVQRSSDECECGRCLCGGRDVVERRAVAKRLLEQR